jgi:hypothetical protein
MVTDFSTTLENSKLYTTSTPPSYTRFYPKSPTRSYYPSPTRLKRMDTPITVKVSTSSRG